MALMMAVFWLFPFMSVHSLREFFCIPFLLIGSYHIANPKLNNRSVFTAAFFFALAFCFRVQSIFIPLGTGIFLLLKKEQFKQGLLFGFAFILFFLLTQGLFDFIHYGNPLASTLAYIKFNANPVNIGVQPQGPWYQYLATLAGILFGLSFFPLAWGYIYSVRISRSLAMLFVASLLFFVFHSYYSNKQERFILPFVPYFLLLGSIGFQHYYEKNKVWLKKATMFLAGWFIVINTAALLVLTFTYSKRSRVEAMSYLRKKNDVSNIIIESNHELPMLPVYYLGKHLSYNTLSSDRSTEDLKAETDTSAKPKPNYVIMTGNKDFEMRLQRLRSLYPQIRHEADITPGWVDKIVYQLNPKHNPNETWHIYRLE
jgi:hypothetical protein